MSTGLHKDLEIGENHRIQCLEYANAAARLAAVGFTTADVGRAARQQDDGSFWLLTAISPNTWVQFSTSAIAGSVKSGLLQPGAFSGSPKKAAVTFGTAYTDTSYAMTIAVVTDGSKTFAVEVESKLSTGFTVNLHSNNVSGLVEVDWHSAVLGS